MVQTKDDSVLRLWGHAPGCNLEGGSPPAKQLLFDCVRGRLAGWFSWHGADATAKSTLSELLAVLATRHVYSESASASQHAAQGIYFDRTAASGCHWYDLYAAGLTYLEASGSDGRYRLVEPLAPQLAHHLNKQLQPDVPHPSTRAGKTLLRLNMGKTGATVGWEAVLPC